MPSTYLTNGFTATVLETREIVHCPDPFDIRFRYEVQLSGGNDSEKAAAPVNSGSLVLGSKRSSHFGTRHWHGRMNFLCLQVCLGKTAQETLLGSVYLPDLLQRRLKSGCLATADGEVMQVG